MNQKQIKYLDNRITTEARTIRARINHDFNEQKEKLFNELTVKQDEEYKSKLESVSKEQLVALLFRLFHEEHSKYYDTRDYTIKGSFLSADNYVSIKKRDLLDLDHFIDNFDEMATQKFSAIYKNYDELVDRLKAEVNRLRDRINLGEASDALESLDAFIDRWNKTIFAVETLDCAENTKKTRERK